MSPKTSQGTIVFSHANSFPAGTYRRLFEVWQAQGYAVHAIEKYGHDPQYPVTGNWTRLRDQLIHFIEAHGAPAAPVYLVGHSFGGFLSLMAAAKRPDLARGVVMLDSPIIGGVLATTVRIFKATGMGRRFSPGEISKKRRNQWPTREDALTHFQSKPLFARFDPQVLHDYIACGIEAERAGKAHTLSFRREVETDIYNNLPHHLVPLLRKHPLRCPLAFIGGTESVEVQRVGMRSTQRLTQGRVSWIEGSHLFPFEKPQAAAEEVLRWLALFVQTEGQTARK